MHRNVTGATGICRCFNTRAICAPVAEQRDSVPTPCTRPVSPKKIQLTTRCAKGGHDSLIFRFSQAAKTSDNLDTRLKAQRRNANPSTRPCANHTAAEHKQMDDDGNDFVNLTATVVNMIAALAMILLRADCTMHRGHHIMPLNR